MKVIPPLAITTSILTSSTLPEVAPTAYSSGTTYPVSQQVALAGALGLVGVYESQQPNNFGNALTNAFWWKFIGNVYEVYSVATTYPLDYVVTDPANHLLYISLAAGNTGNALTNAAKWLSLGATNRYAMFDTLRSTGTVGQGTINVTLTPGKRIDSLALLQMSNVRSVTITMTLAGAVVYTKTVNLVAQYIDSWTSWMFGGVTLRKSFIAFDLPPYTTGVITITLTGVGAISCGACVVGKYVDIGKVEYGAESDVINYSSVTRDFAGGVNLMVQRRNVPKSINNIWTPKARVNVLRDVRDLLNGTPAVWAGIDDSTDEYFEAILIVGFYKRFLINLAFVNDAKVSLELEEI